MGLVSLRLQKTQRNLYTPSFTLLMFGRHSYSMYFSSMVISIIHYLFQVIWNWTVIPIMTPSLKETSWRTLQGCPVPYISFFRDNFIVISGSYKYLYKTGINSWKLLVTIFGNTNPHIGFGASNTFWFWTRKLYWIVCDFY